ncbi:MAG: pyridoxal-phosphate dependent enzyme [Vicinamibacterales bacterium]
MVTALDILAARRRIAPFVSPTPLAASSWLTDASGRPVRLKLESLNLTCSFKVRGAFNALLHMLEVTPGALTAAAVVTASAGNHGRALACAAERLGLRAVVFTPSGAPRAKRDAIRAHGAVLHDEAPDYDAAERAARDYAELEGGVYISPYNHPDVIAGAGTVGLEVIEACPEAGAVIVPLGGGGLCSGIGVAIRAASPGTRVIGVEADASTPFTTGRAHGAITRIEPRPTLADGLAGNLEPDAITFPLVQLVVDDVVTVSEQAIGRAMRQAGAHDHLIVEGSAATALAAAAAHPPEVNGPLVAIVTGANVDLDVWTTAVAAHA